VTDRISDQVAQQIRAAIGMHALGDDVTFDVGLTAVPTPTGQFQPMMVVALAIPNPADIGQKLVGAGMMDLGVNQAAIGQFVAQTLEALRAQRAAGLQVPQHTGNGTKRPRSWDDMEALGTHEDVERHLRGDR
jgi:hypothetical protein